jgi:hypothetical protein
VGRGGGAISIKRTWEEPGPRMCGLLDSIKPTYQVSQVPEL